MQIVVDALLVADVEIDERDGHTAQFGEIVQGLLAFDALIDAVKEE